MQRELKDKLRWRRSCFPQTEETNWMWKTYVQPIRSENFWRSTNRERVILPSSQAKLRKNTLFIDQSAFSNFALFVIRQKIADAVNAVGVTVRTTAEVREKWKSLHSQAKREFTELAKEQKKTGGGPAPKMPSTSTAKIIDLLKDTPLFTGLEGFESKGGRIFISYNWYLKLKISLYF